MSQVRSSRLTGAVSGMVVAIASGAAIAGPTAPDGIWYTKNDESIIKVAPCAETADAFCGTLVWLKEPNEKDGTPKRDTLNKDPAKRHRTIVGLEILIEMKAEDDHWSGKAYNPEDGKKYSITFKVQEENDKAALRGCILGFLCQTETFTRAKEVPGGEPALADAGHHGKHHKKKDAATE